MLTSWYLLGDCFSDKIESYIFKKKFFYKNKKEKSVFVYCFEKIIGEKNAFYLFSLTPLIISTFIVLKIMNILYIKHIS